MAHLPSGDFSREQIEDQLKFLDRAHRMSCSDPDDPSRTTSYSISASIIRQLLDECSQKSYPASAG